MHRKIIHIDADCFFAAIEMRDNPALRDRPIAVGGSANRRGVISTCNYPARTFGVRSAMATAQALKLCPDLLLLPHRMEAYQEASQAMRAIFKRYTPLVEPLSLDEAYLDVTDATDHQGSATLMAEDIRQAVHREVGITVSAGVSSARFLAKIASDWRKPDGLFVIPPNQVDTFVAALPVSKLHGVGKVTAEKLHRRGLYTCADVRRWSADDLAAQFGQFGLRLHELAWGIDQRTVKTTRLRKSLSVEHTYARDLSGWGACAQHLPGLLAELSQRLDRLDASYRVVKAFVKVKFNDFTTTTLERAGTAPMLGDYGELLQAAVQRRPRAVRLLGLGVRFAPPSGSRTPIQLDLFDPT